MSPPAEEDVRRLLAKHRNLLVPHYLIHSFLYYRCDVSIISDHLYDEICQRLYTEWRYVNHIHKHMVDRDMLNAGTGYHLKYTARVKKGAIAMAEVYGVRATSVK